VELAGEAIVQARPIIHPVIQPRLPVPPLILAPLVADGRHWRWDVAHNPDPLSLAQIGLVERIDRAEIVPYAMRVCGGYLYTAPRGDPPVVTAPRSRASLDARARELDARIGAALGLELDPLVGVTDPLAIALRGEPPPLEEALARYLAFYELFGSELGPLIAAARSTLTAAQLGGARTSAVEQTLLAAARGELEGYEAAERLGMLAPAWDVAVPTYGERRGIVPAAIRRARTIASTLVAPPPPAETDDLARAAADLAERDDHWFARAQLLVRRAVLARAAALGLDPDDAFWIPLDELLDGNVLDPDDVRRRASAARNAAARAERWMMPRSVGGPPEAPARALHGVGTGPRVTGRIVRYPTLAAAISASTGDVVVTRAVTPALAIQVIGCAALVSETGGLLDHGAALARELGITCVVGCHDAWSLLTDGMVVTVDGDAGSVEISS
jgi:pyruvate,water dikinase